MASSIQYGKEFEFDFKASAIRENVYIERLKDHGYFGTNGDENQRFTPSNAYDFEMLYKGIAFKLEMKSISGKSLPMGDKAQKQLARLIKVNELLNKCNIKNKCGYVIQFRYSGRVFYIDAMDIFNFLSLSGKKSINYDDIIVNGGREIDYYVPKLKPKYYIKSFCEGVFRNFKEDR